MAERPKSLLIPFLAAAVVAGFARMVAEKIKRDRELRRPGPKHPQDS
ncbi:hypothetical protein [Arthrobacter mobilis]|uniref:Uncharacterized protein n=1 Tax=Arthrobacter mobilis TaxID=2724944 RepID=A0A7X6HD49_9MICC|nr:hypothetical protein [Arthrobacter mobilis]NKX54330.1 hypothetical protein [Arthrobacter mobilis]